QELPRVTQFSERRVLVDVPRRRPGLPSDFVEHLVELSDDGERHSADVLDPLVLVDEPGGIDVDSRRHLPLGGEHVLKSIVRVHYVSLVAAAAASGVPMSRVPVVTSVAPGQMVLRCCPMLVAPGNIASARLRDTTSGP